MTRLLIVDDEQFTVDMLQTFLEINGYQVFGAYNGEDGLVLVQVERPEVIILDLMLPDIEGYEVCRRLRTGPDTAHLPILILSARAEAASRERAILAGADGYLTKPVQFPVLLSELTRLLALQRQYQTPAEPLPAPTATAPVPNATAPAPSPPTTTPASAPPAPPINAPKVDVPSANPMQVKPDQPKPLS